MGGRTLRPVGEHFIHLQIGRRVLWDRVVVIKNLRHTYILGQVLHRLNWFGTGYSTTGKHYIAINGQVMSHSVLQALDYLIIKTKGRVTLPPFLCQCLLLKLKSINYQTLLTCMKWMLIHSSFQKVSFCWKFCTGLTTRPYNIWTSQPLVLIMYLVVLARNANCIYAPCRKVWGSSWGQLEKTLAWHLKATSPNTSKYKFTTGTR